MQTFFTIIATFILLYVPIIFGINLLHALAPIALIYLLLHVRKTVKLLQIKEVFTVLVINCIITIYLFMVILVNNEPLRTVLANVYILLEVIPVSLMIIILNRKNNKATILDIVIGAAILQSIFSVISYISPNLQSFFVQQMVNKGSSGVYLSLANYRMYGFSNFLTFATPALQSIIAFVIMIKIHMKQYKWLLVLPIIIFSAMINARTSLVVLLIGLLFIILSGMSKSYSRIFLSTILITVISVIIFNNNLLITANSDNETFQWIAKGYNEIILFLNGDASDGYFSYVTGQNQYSFPSGINLIFGEGIRVMSRNSSNFRSDIGYVNDIWLGGLLYVAMLIGVILYFFITGRKVFKDLERNNTNLISYFLLTILLVLNFKGFIFGFNPVINVIYLLYFSLMIESYYKKRK